MTFTIGDKVLYHGTRTIRICTITSVYISYCVVETSDNHQFYAIYDKLTKLATSIR